MSSLLLARSVRFDNECVLIPEHLSPQKKRLLNVVTRSWSVPIWPTGNNHPGPVPEGSEEEKDRGRKLTVVLPSFVSPKKTKPSPPPLSPCLRSPDRLTASTSAPLSPESHDRHLRSPIIRSVSNPLPTVPLRPCCKDCYHAVEAYLAAPNTTPERMSRGALLRHESDILPEIEGIRGCHSTRVKVDEFVLKGFENSMDPLKEEDPSDIEEDESLEDDEDQLFPLPSPRRTPTSSPSTSLTNLSLSTNANLDPLSSITCNTSAPRISSPLCSPCTEPQNGPDESSPHHEQHNRRKSNSLSSASPDHHRYSGEGKNNSGTSPPEKRPRGSSLSSFGESFTRGSAALLKGVGDMVSGGGSAGGILSV